ncbi:MAG: YegS/Rv2252/BmrU family lipid kinase [Clostridia bacterium]|nr:YegS/Rv2252/BmrU family lipid kinase [Clostridia bacterium]
MKTIFIINPQAGKGNDIAKLIDSIESIAAKLNADASFYVTEAPGDGEHFVRQYCKEHGSARFIACGGDGTLGEVLGGIIGFDGSEAGVLPMGTGNDFCRNFGSGACFESIAMQLTGTSVKCDAIHYRTCIDGKIKEGYCANMFNIGFDCAVADKTTEIKTKTFASGSMAYFLSIIVTLIKKKGTNIKIELDGRLCHDGELLLTSVANGCFCGGGIKSNPLARVNDGLININIIKNMSHLKFISLLPYYMKGSFIGLKRAADVITSQKCKKVTITPNDGKIRLCIDGEIIDAGKTEFEVVHDAFNFVVPLAKQTEYTLA